MQALDQVTSFHIVAIGGGHGLGRVLSALSAYGENITGIVTTTDNGGSTGRIRACQGGIAWGDTRNCLNQLVTEPSVGSMMFEYRFKGTGELNGHNLGNLMLTALDNLSVRPFDAITLIRDMLQIKTHIVPMSEHPADLSALTQDNQWICGETSVDELAHAPKRLAIEPAVPATKEAIDAIANANLILLGPGSFLTSVMPPLLLEGLSQALHQSQADIYFITNLDKENGPANQLALSEQLHWCERAMKGREITGIITDTVKEDLLDRYHQAVQPLASMNHQWRHDRIKLKQAIEQLLILR